jgi:hopanoid biosynthesis associated protein HpnK
MSAVRVIVHADDFGLSKKINDGILRAHRDGILTSTSLMANGEAFEHAVAMARSTPSLDIGIHLTLIEERSLLNSVQIPTLVDPEGKFCRHAFQFVQRYLLGKINLREVHAELEAQIQKVLASGINPTHLDSHQHVHILPGVLKVVVKLSQTYGIPSIRLPQETVSFGKMGNVPLARILQALVLNLFCRMTRGTIKERTEFFAGFLYGGNLNKENFRKLLAHLPRGGTCEIMCHPGLEEADSRYAHWHYHWRDELNALIDDEIRQLVRNKSIQLISYRELNGVV